VPGDVDRKKGAEPRHEPGARGREASGTQPELREQRKKSVAGTQICEERFVRVCGISGTLEDHPVPLVKRVGFVRREVIAIGIRVPVNCMPE
jgi:hypothetical protein